jgi:hypothetical protein
MIYGNLRIVANLYLEILSYNTITIATCQHKLLQVETKQTLQNGVEHHTKVI